MPRKTNTREKLVASTEYPILARSYGFASVDEICKHSGVLKGSFYHFFKSKSDLAVAAIENHWERERPKLDRAFSAQVAPMQRISGWFDAVRGEQERQKAAFGRVVGCTYPSVGSELGAKYPQVRKVCRTMNGNVCRYLESAIRDAQRDGDVPPGNPAVLALQLHSYWTGLVQQAKLSDDLGLLDGMETGVFRLLGVRPKGR